MRFTGRLRASRFVLLTVRSRTGGRKWHGTMEQVLTEVARLEDALADIRYYADEMKAGDDGAGWGGLITFAGDADRTVRTPPLVAGDPLNA